MRTANTNPSYLHHIRLGGNWNSWIRTAGTGRDATDAAKETNPGNNCCDTDHYRDAVERLAEMKKGQGIS